MPDFKSKEDYERWKAQRLKDLQQRKQTPDMPPAPPEKEPQKDKGEYATERPPAITPDNMTKSELSGIDELFRNSWEIYKRRIGTLISLYILSFLFFIISLGFFLGIGYLLSIILPDSKTALIAFGGVTGMLAGFTVMFWGLAAVIFAVVDENLGIKDALGRGWQRVWAFIWFFSIAGFIITGGFLLFFIPGVIFLVWFAFAQFVLASEDESGMNALLKSKEYVSGRWFEVFVRLFVVWLVSVGVGIVPFIGPFLSILFIPFMMIFTFLIYKELKDVKGDVVYSSSAGEKFKWIGAGTLGYIVLPVIIILVLGASLTIPLMLLTNMMKSQGQEFTLSPEKWPKEGMITQQPPSGIEPSPKSDMKKPEAAGEAVIVKNGVTETYILKTGFFSDTRFADPKKATISFQIPAEEHSNARRIEMTLDTTQIGRHHADGKTINDSMFGGSPVNIGEVTPEGITANFRYIADGGQIFPPKNSCDILIASPYTGTQDGTFAGEVYDCTVHSAGIDYNISSVKFRMTGVPSR